MPDTFARLSRALAARYHLEREIGRGGMATVYLARDQKHPRKVAVKVLHPELAAAIGPARFAREIEIAARLTHPHILTLIDSGESDGFLYYVMPFVEGESLEARLEREGRLSPADAVRLIGQVASALDYAHSQGVIHRDIKPANILLSAGQAIVADFGVARAVESAGAERLTGTGMALGTPTYMSPEQAFGEDSVDGRADVYAMGCVLYEMLVGRPPFEAASPQALLAQHAMRVAPRLRTLLPELPLFLDRAVSRALAKEPDERFATAAAMAETLLSGVVVDQVGRRRIAVLPPVNVSNDPDHDYLVLGLHEALISRLGHGDAAVLARTSVLQYHGTSLPAHEICRQLSADAVVESSLFRAQDEIEVQARLIDGETEESLWAGSYDGKARNVLALYREICDSISREVHGTLGRRAATSGARPVANPIALERYMRGRVHQQTFNPLDLDRAMRYYEAALEAQPDFAPAYAGMALIWGSRSVLGMVPPSEAGPAWRETAARAVELDPELAEAHQALAQGYAWYTFEWDRAEAAFRRATELDPNEPQARIFYSHFLAMMRRVEESDVQMRQALEIDPFNPFTQLLYGAQLGLTGRAGEAIAQLSGIPPNPLRSHVLAWQFVARDELDTALEHYRDYFQLLGDQEMAATLKDDSGPREAFARAAALLTERAGSRFVKPNNLVYLHALAGNTDLALDWAERAVEMRDHEVAYWGAVSSWALVLRGEPRFQAILEKLGVGGGGR